jgi:hypothetical protein
MIEGNVFLEDYYQVFDWRGGGRFFVWAAEGSGRPLLK